MRSSRRRVWFLQPFISPTFTSHLTLFVYEFPRVRHLWLTCHPLHGFLFSFCINYCVLHFYCDPFWGTYSMICDLRILQNSSLTLLSARCTTRSPLPSHTGLSFLSLMCFHLLILFCDSPWACLGEWNLWSVWWLSIIFHHSTFSWQSTSS